MIISLIAAVSAENVIGYQNQLPWHLPADLAHFKKLTLNKPIVMGRKTFLSIGKPLPQRRNIILTHDPNFAAAGTEIFHSIPELLAALKDEPEIMIIGGEAIFSQFLPLAQRIYLTQIQQSFPGDTFFPAIDMASWHELSRENYTPDEKNAYNYSFIVLETR